MADDFLLTEQGGMCALVGDECCSYISNSSNIIAGHLLLVKQLEELLSKLGQCH